MFKKIALMIISAMLFTIPCNAYGYKAQSYALIEMETGRMLDGRNTNLRLPMASTTKIMTGIIACESGNLDKIYTVPEEATKVEGSSMYLVPGEKITLRDLTYGLMLESGNDAANTIAICLSGSVDAFVDKMNKKAAELKLYNTHYATPSGLDGKDHYTTSLDLARLGAYAMHNPEFRKIVSTTKKYVTLNGVKDGRVLYNHNALLRTYKGAIGIKTGYIKRSGRCLVSCAERNGVTLIAATLNCHDDLEEHKTLLDYGFSVLKPRPLFPCCPDISVKVTGGTSDSVICKYNTNLTAGLKDSEVSRVKMKINVPKSVAAPIKKGQKLGEIVFTLDGALLNKTDITAAETVLKPEKKPGAFEQFIGYLGQFIFRKKPCRQS